MSQKTNDRTTRSNYLLHNVLIFVLLIVVVVLFVLLTRSTKSIVRAPGTLPADAVACGVEGGGFSCSGLLDHKLTLANVPPSVTPYLLPISASDESKFAGLPKDGFQCIISIAGNLAFFDKGGEMVKSFASPVTMQIAFTGNDVEKLSGCKSGLTEADLVPVYLYLPDADARVSIWKPFQNYRMDGSTATIEFQFWGDPPIGWGSPKYK